MAEKIASERAAAEKAAAEKAAAEKAAAEKAAAEKAAAEKAAAEKAAAEKAAEKAAAEAPAPATAAALENPDELPWFHTDEKGEYVGPVTPPQLREQYAAGTLDADALFFTEGMEEWLPLAEVAVALGIELGADAAAAEAEARAWAAAEAEAKAQTEAAGAVAAAAAEAIADVAPHPDELPWYHTDESGEYVGPLTPPELRAQYAAGTLDADALFFTEGMEEWLPLADVAAALGIEVGSPGAEAAQATERDPEAEAQEWWCTDDAGEYVGPLTPPELRELHAGGALAADALFFTEGMEEWLPLADVAAALGM